ncbi:MAG: polysaccharide biosynthesis/export family protein [Opitutales bacterium]
MNRLYPSVFYIFLTFALALTANAQPREGEKADERPLVISDNYRLSHKDLLRVEVFQEPDLIKDARVANDGTITLPLIGKVPVRGRTLVESQELITELYNRDYLVNPQITILILEYSERRVEVFGSVNRPGPVLIPPEEPMTLTEAIASAGGLSRIAAEDKIALTRQMPNGRSEVFQFNFKKILRDPKVVDPEVIDGDKIFVPESTFGN